MVEGPIIRPRDLPEQLLMISAASQESLLSPEEGLDSMKRSLVSRWRICRRHFSERPEKRLRPQNFYRSSSRR